MQAASPKATPKAQDGKPLSAPQKGLQKLGLSNAVDLCLHLPLRYEDETQITPMLELRVGDAAQVEGVVTACEVAYRPRRQLVVMLSDATETVALRFLNFYGSQQKLLAEGTRIRARGEPRMGHYGMEFVHPSYNKVEEGAPLKTALTPVYPTVAGLPQAYLRKVIASALERTCFEDTLPPTLWPALKVPLLDAALRSLHNPGVGDSLESLQERTHPAWVRLKFEELVAQQLSHTKAKRQRAAMKANALKMPPPQPSPADAGEGVKMQLTMQLRSALPFALTAAQERCASEISADIAKPVPMHRLLQGDVGSGKTVVAALAAAQCIAAGFQCVLMAPTEILAEQHFRKMIEWIEPLGVKVVWLTGSLKAADKRRAHATINSGQAQLIVGTHAVIQDKVEFANLGLAIVDEQHRFGVSQRLSLRGKSEADVQPHLLMMSATPIPRTLAMTYFADLDVSVIDELPPGRTPIVTKVFSDEKRDEVLERIAHSVSEGKQVYWVCPLVEESEVLDLQNATAVHQELTAMLAPAMVVLLHGRMSASEKQAAMALFVDGTAAVMVATTVIEVGVDVPNASLMVIEHAERFGLSQLHQLRGRVGRGAQASVCVLLYSGRLSEAGRVRMKVMRDSTDGFVIAQTDLELRGPGEMLGARQSGAPLLRFADLQRDEDLIPAARDAAQKLLLQYPELAEQHLQRWLRTREAYLSA
jgi:ATP-dependent DNA helicase RecG